MSAGPDPGPLGLDERLRAAQHKARVLREALPWITSSAGATVVVKYGGNAMAGDRLVASFAADVALLRMVGLHVVVVHGGGPQISDLSDRLGLATEFADGRRVTDAATLEAVRMALLGQVAPRLVGLIEDAGVRAVSVSGGDGGLLRTVAARPGGRDLGHVGHVAAVDPAVLRTLAQQGCVPVVAPLGRDADGTERNVNADEVAGALAAELRASKLIYLSDVAGLYESFGSEGEAGATGLISEIDAAALRRMRDDGALAAGMVPKVDGILTGLDAGVARAHLLDGRVEHALLLEIFTDEGVGTMVLADGGAGER